jgi:hypothetical protein
MALSGLVMAVLAGVVFWLWLKVTDGEIGPALVATAISMVVGAMKLAIKIQEPREDGWLRAKGPVYASVCGAESRSKPDGQLTGETFQSLSRRPASSLMRSRSN